MRIILDANIFLNVIFEEKQFLESSRKLLKQIESKKFDARISAITLAEIIWIVHRESGLKKAKEVQSYMRELSDLQIVKITPIEERAVFGTLSLIEKYGLSLVDALVVSTAIINKCNVVTRDEKIKKVKEIKVNAPDEI